MLRNDKGDSWKDTTQEANRVLKPFKGTWRPQHPVKRFLHINAKSAPTHDIDFEFISTHIQGKWHLAAVQSKCDWETRIKVTPACVITLGNVFVCSIYLPKGSGFNIREKAKQHGNIESVSVVVKAERTNTSRFVLLKYTHVSTNSMCTLCDIVQRAENTFTRHIYRINGTYTRQATSENTQIM